MVIDDCISVLHAKLVVYYGFGFRLCPNGSLYSIDDLIPMVVQCLFDGACWVLDVTDKPEIVKNNCTVINSIACVSYSDNDPSFLALESRD